MKRTAYLKKPKSLGGWLALAAMTAHCLMSVLCITAGPRPAGALAAEGGWPFEPIVICSPEGTRTIPAAEAARLWGGASVPALGSSPTPDRIPADRENCAMCQAVCAAAIAFLLANILLFVASARPPRLAALISRPYAAPALRLTRCRAPPAFV